MSINKSVFSVFAIAALIVSGFFVPNAAKAISSGVIINEFVSNPSSGNEWVELLNTSGSPVDLIGWKLTELTNPDTAPEETDWIALSGTIPANGILVFEVAGTNLNNTGDSIGLYDNSPSLLQRVTYGDVLGYLVTPGLEAAPTSGKSGAYISGAWQTDQTPTKGWFNDAGTEGAAPLLSTIDEALSAEGVGIDSNIGELENPSATPSDEEDALYFEKTGEGKIVFTDSLNLSDQDTVAVLQSLGEAMEMSNGHVAFDSETAQAMTDTGAKIYMYGLGFSETPNIIVKDDEGAVIDPEDENYPEISISEYTGGTLIFTASHFTQFDVEELPVTNETTGSQYSTIQSAIDDASEGDVISVAAGTYEESVLIESALTLKSAETEKPVITGTSSENYILEINGVNDVVLDNLEINGGGSETGDNGFDYGILVSGAGTGSNPVEIKNSAVKNIWNTSSNGINVENSSYVLVHHSSISSFHKRGIRFINSEGKFYDNDVKGDSVDGTTRVQNLVNLWGGSTVEIYNNILHDAKSLSGTPTWDSPAIFVSSYGGDGASSADIHDNEIYNGDSGIIVSSVYSETDTSSAEITNNNLHDLNWAINFEKSSATAVIHGNSFATVNKAVNSENGDGVFMMDSVINAENNYWGAASGPSGEGAGDGGSVVANIDYRPWLLEEGGTIYDQTIALTEVNGWTLISAPQLLSDAPAVASDDGGSAALLVYEGGEFVSPSEFSADMKKPVGAFYAKTENKGGVGFKYAESGPANTSKDLTVGWNLVGTNNAGLAQDEFSSIQNTGTDAGMVTLYVSDTYNSRKEAANSDFYTSWGGDGNHDINANPITNLPGNNLSIYDGYWVFMNTTKEFVKNL
ncbi:MAG: hypothetical protein A2736_02650 [Candidatus Yanofskybacteria bacterium RIFCSPHIGHO2_01_FULL_41_27]|uniref:LTD domain-containing protein n=1 Tax=Candidatus Yanofskybacteria bacterium RIFCSPHIGHO2_01_FULL_41_27 TaxID=1802662 RepID=A0A1F8EID9_9BACT|nr:MAG: hypothetical protein A2736_02650 [Candidatus Yanofskybacteria bacterium RIFCSPHIGHO2_01_FULL_41_27]